MANPLLLVSLASSSLYYLTQHWQPFPGSVVLKGLSVTPLAWLAWQRLRSRDGVLLGSALALGSLGDVLLDVSAALFPAGLAAFLAGHLVYIGLFSRNRPKPCVLTIGEKAMVIGLALFAAGMAFWLIPAVGTLAPAVAVYMGALTAMVVSAVALQLPERWVVAGAILFLISDSLLAVDKFRMPVPGREVLVWSTYYVGQLGIALGFLRSKGVRLW